MLLFGAVRDGGGLVKMKTCKQIADIHFFRCYFSTLVRVCVRRILFVFTAVALCMGIIRSVMVKDDNERKIHVYFSLEWKIRREWC